MTGSTTPLGDALASAAFGYAGCLEYVEDFMREWNATLRDPLGRAGLTTAYQQAQADGMGQGGPRCCGTAAGRRRPWCRTGPRRFDGRLFCDEDCADSYRAEWGNDG